jgi:hypothetical protein
MSSFKIEENPNLESIHDRPENFLRLLNLSSKLDVIEFGCTDDLEDALSSVQINN